MGDYCKTAVAKLREEIGPKGRVLLALSGGVDSSVLAALLAEAVGDRLTCVFVDHGLMRKNEGDEVEDAFRQVGRELRPGGRRGAVPLQAGRRRATPSRSGKIIGEEFIRVFRGRGQEASASPMRTSWPRAPFIPTSSSPASATPPSSRATTTCGGLPDVCGLQGRSSSPCDLLFKDEVRAAGPGAGPARVPGHAPALPRPRPCHPRSSAISPRKRLDTLRDADFIFREEIAKAGEDRNLNQYFAVLTNTRSVGVMGDGRTYDYTLALRAVTTSDFMTADWARIPYERAGPDLRPHRQRGQGHQPDRLRYHQSKPPATIEWE